MGIGERYHDRLKKTFRKLWLEYQKSEQLLLLKISLYANNITLDPKGLVPYALVFGEYPITRISGEVKTIKRAIAERPSLATAARW